MYRMELNRTEMTEQKKKKETEVRKYDKMRRDCEKFHEDFRFAVIDHQASGLAGQPSKLNKMKVPCSRARFAHPLTHPRRHAPVRSG